jgi:drug/metabolite transporter (DMT)-like permease
MNKGATYMLSSSFAFSLMAVFVKLAGERLPISEIMLARAVLSIFISYGFVRYAGLAPLGNNRPLLLLRGLFGCCALGCLYYSITHLPLAEATVIQYLHPTFTAILAALTIREGIPKFIMGASVLSLLGVTLVAQPEFGASGVASLGFPPLALAAAVAGALLSAAAYVAVRRLSQTEDPFVIILYFPMVSVPVLLPFVWSEALLPTGMEWLYLLGVGITTQAGQIWLTRGLARLPAARGTALSYAQVIFAAIWGILFFSETPSLWTGIGALLIISGICIVALSSKAKSDTPGDASDAKGPDALLR